MRPCLARPFAPWLPLLMLLISGCFEELPWDKVEDTALPDLDGDGYSVMRGDCDDQDPERHPDAQEVCDELDVDEDCDDFADDEDPEGALGATTWFQDQDGDGYASDDDPGRELCDPDETWNIVVQGDCDDDDPAVNPDATEVCDELGTDEDCDGLVDDDDDSLDPESASTWYPDIDEDGYGDPDAAVVACIQPEGTLTDDSDCDDSDPNINPDGHEICDLENADEDCDGWADDVDPSVDRDTRFTFYPDDDHDGYGDPDNPADYCDAPDWHTELALATDCDDGDPAINIDAQEVCDELGADEDCDGLIDDEDDSVDPSGLSTWYVDADEDGWSEGSTVSACTQPSGSVAKATDLDCDDADPTQHPGADEYCNGEDDDCDGDTDEDDAVDVSTWYADIDMDGYGDPNSSDIDCDQPSGYLALADDCDDLDPTQHPGADEHCNGEDDDCDGTTDEADAIDASTWYTDADADGWGDAATAVDACSQPSGYVTDATDCDDADASINPGVDETCDGVDNDCDGDTDEDDAIDAGTWTTDADADGWGDNSTAVDACEQPSGTVAATASDDCDDGDPTQHPGAEERCNGEDDDCDGTTDEDDAIDVLTWYADIDRDGYGDPASPDIDCEQPSGYLADAGDCDDLDATQHPGADERCNGEDDDCDGSTDEDDAVDAATWYLDGDADGYGDASVTTSACAQPSGYVTDATDCDDARADVSPGATEICDDDQVDEDCDGLADDDDSSADPATMSTWYLDLDGDGVGSSAHGSEGPRCDPSAGYVASDGDCDEFDASVHPLHDEICDGRDNDCDAGTAEDGVISLGAHAYASLAAAVAAAGSGDEVMLCDGSYSANVTTTAPLTIRSLNGAASTSLDGGGVGAILTMGDDLWLQGLTLTDGAGHTGGAVDGSIGGGATLAIQDCVFDGNLAAYGGAIYATDLDLSIADCDFVANEATDDGGALFAARGTALDLSSSSFEGNEAGRGGGAWLEDLDVFGGGFQDNIAAEGGAVFLAGATLEAATLEENLASSSGGGAYLDDGSSLLGGVVQLNLAPSGGGVAIAGDACSLDQASDGSGATVTLNEATVYGGGVVVFAVDAPVLNSATVSDNLAVYGGGVYAQSATSLSGAALEISGNQASNTGGGLYLMDVTQVAFWDLILSSNSSGSNGGGAMIDGNSADLYVFGSIIEDNMAGSLGGGLYLRDTANAAFTSMVLERNQSNGTQGGGFYLDTGVVLYASGSFGAGADANSPDDIGLTGSSYSFTSLANCDSDHLSCTGL
jgi:predicted outer membrane repeat protein